jgi:TolB-like protein
MRISRRRGYVVLALAVGACNPAPPGAVTPERQRQAEEAAREAVAREKSLDVISLSPRSVGIPPFNVNVRDTTLTPLSYGLADLLVTDLARSSQLEVVDRVRLDAVLREIQLVQSGRVDTATAPRVGKLIQARQLVLGSLDQRAGSDLGLQARIADVASGKTRTAVSATAPVERILEAEKQLAFNLFDQLGVNLTPAERRNVEQLPTKDVQALLAYSRGVRYEIEGNYQAAGLEYGRAVQLDPQFQAAVTHLQEVQAPPATEVRAVGAGAESPRPPAAWAATAVVDEINGPYVSPLGRLQMGGPADPSFPEPSATVTITVTTP